MTKRGDGTRQVTYAGHPCTGTSGDTKAGQTTGEGLTDFGAAWDAVATSSHAVEPIGSDPGGTDGGYGGDNGSGD